MTYVQLMYHGHTGIFWSNSDKGQIHCMRNSELPQALLFNCSFCFNEIRCQISFLKNGHNAFLKASSYIIFQQISPALVPMETGLGKLLWLPRPNSKELSLVKFSFKLSVEICKRVVGNNYVLLNIYIYIYSTADLQEYKQVQEKHVAQWPSTGVDPGFSAFSFWDQLTLKASKLFDGQFQASLYVVVSSHLWELALTSRPLEKHFFTTEGRFTNKHLGHTYNIAQKD